MTFDLAAILAQPATISPRSLEPDFVEAIDEMVSCEVRGGYTPLGEVIDRAMEYASVDDPSDQELAYAQQQLAQALRKQAVEQEAGEGDYERMKRAFAALEADGVVCREDYTCCMTCGSAQIWDEIKTMLENGTMVNGYVFFHQQDTERAVDGGGVYFAYGATDDGDDASVAIGQRLADALGAQGLEVEWDGSIHKRIGLKLNWFRPLPEDVYQMVRATPLPS